MTKRHENKWKMISCASEFLNVINTACAGRHNVQRHQCPSPNGKHREKQLFLFLFRHLSKNATIRHDDGGNRIRGNSSKY